MATLSTETDGARNPDLTQMLIVDTDVHVHESPGELADYCDMPWKVALENMASLPETYLDIPGFSPGVSDGSYQARFPTTHEGARKVTTPAQMSEELRELHVDIGILFPDHLLKLPVLTQTDYASALSRAYNAWIVDKWARPETGLLACLVACPQDPVDTAREIGRYADDPRVVGICLPCAGLDPLWGNRRYDPIWEAAEQAGLPVLLHSVTVTHPVFPFNNHGFDTELGRHACSHTFSIIANLVHMITTGVVVRYPSLRIAVTEAGISWMPFLMNRLDKEYLERRREVPFLKERPSHYLKRIYVATQPIEEPEDLADIATLVDLYHGHETTMFASDWPHHDFDHPMKLAQVPFSADTQRRIFGENALEFFRIDRNGRRLGQTSGPSRSQASE